MTHQHRPVASKVLFVKVDLKTITFDNLLIPAPQQSALVGDRLVYALARDELLDAQVSGGTTPTNNAQGCMRNALIPAVLGRCNERPIKCTVCKEALTYGLGV